MHSTIHAVCGQQKGQNRAKSHVSLILNFFFFLVKRAGHHFGFFKRAGRHEKGAGHHEKGAGRRALQKKPRQNTEHFYLVSMPGGVFKRSHQSALEMCNLSWTP